MSFARVVTIAALSMCLSLEGMSVAHASPATSEAKSEAVAAGPKGAAEPRDAAEPGDVAEPEAVAEPDAGEQAAMFEDALLQEALDRYKEGRELFEANRFLKAAAAYQRSYAAVHVGRTLYNIGLSYELGGDIVRSLAAYTRYAELPDCPAPKELCADRRGEVLATITRLKALVGVLTIVIDDDVDLRGIDIDGRTVQLQHFPLILDPGRYELRVRGRKRGQVQIRQVQIEAGQRASLVIPGFDEPVPLVVAPPIVRQPEDAPPRISPEERTRRLKLAFYGGVGLTSLSGLAIGITGGLALSAFRRQDERCKGEGVPCSGTEYPEEDRATVTRLKPVANVFVGVTAGLALTTVVVGLFAFSRADGKAGTKKRASTTRLRASPTGLRVRF